MFKRRIPLFRQLEANDCGPSCLKMIAAYYGKKVALDAIKGICDITRLGISVRDIVYCAKKLGLNSAAVKLKTEDARRMPLPAILYLKKGHFVVLENIRCKKGTYFYKILDPDYGRILLTEAQLIEDWHMGKQGVTILLEPSEEFNTSELKTPDSELQQESMKAMILRIVRQNKGSFMWIALLTLIVVVTNWAMPFILKNTIDEGIMNKNSRIVWGMLLSQFLFFLGYMFAGNISGVVTSKTSIRIDLDFITSYIEKIFRLPLRFFETTLRTELIQRMGDLSRLSSFITGNILSIVFSILNILVFSGVLLYYNSRVFGVFCLFSVVTFAYNSYFIRKRKYLDYAGFSINSKRNNMIYEMMTSMSEIKINNAQKARTSVWKKLEEKANGIKIKSVYLNYHMSNGAGILSKLRDISLTGMCAIYVIHGDMTMGTMLMLSFLLGQLASPVNDLIGFFKNLQDAQLSSRRLNEIYKRPDENYTDSMDLSDYTVRKGIRFKNVSFKYAGLYSPYVLTDIDLDIPAGKITAIVGSSGGGKTTLLKLMMGYYKPVKGVISIDDIDMQNIHLDTWRAKCGVVMQDGKIFSGSVAENIAFSDVQPVKDKLEKAVDVACIADKIHRLPMEFNTEIGETGVDLSGGERQRLLIARAVYHQPEFLFFDEATSSLDANTEKHIMDNLHVFFKGRTVVIIAHRLSTVQRADNIVFIEKGQIAEQGTHTELMEKKGLYYQLVRNQLYS